MSLRRLLVGMASLCMTGYLIRVIEIERKQEVNCAAGFDASEPHLGKVSRGAVGMGRAGQGGAFLLVGWTCARGVLEGGMSFSMSDAMSLISYLLGSGGECQPGRRGLPCHILGR